MYAVNRKGVLGPICDVGWGDVDARVVCRYSDFGKSTFKSFSFVIIWNFRQLGFRTGQAVGGSYFGQTVPNKYAMEDVGCTGMEDYLRVSFNKLFLVDIYCSGLPIQDPPHLQHQPRGGSLL